MANLNVEYLAPFEPLPWQYEPWRFTGPTMLLTGGAGGGKSRLAVEKVHAFCKRYPGAYAVVIRKVRVSLTNSTVAFLERTIIGADPTVKHLPSKSRFEYSNGSVLAYFGIENEQQRERLRSIGNRGGVDIALMEEATEFTEDDYNAVSARMRGTAAPWRQVIIVCNPGSPLHWIKRRLIDGQEAKVFLSRAQDNAYNPDEYVTGTLGRLTGVDALRLRDGVWALASGVVYDVWSEAENVTEDAEYVPGGGPLYMGVDDGYTGEYDSTLGVYKAGSHPRVFLFAQMRHDGSINVFNESYAVRRLSDDHVRECAAMLPVEHGRRVLPEYAAVDSSAAELRAILYNNDIYARSATHSVEEGIKVVRTMLAPDRNGMRRIRIHPRCRNLRQEMVSYIIDQATQKPVKDFDHGPDALRYLAWTLREG